MSLPVRVHPHRGDSPKRRRTDDADDIRPEQSASQLGSEAPLALNTKNTFSPPDSGVSSGRKRSSSPTRETRALLQSASPPVLIESLNGLKEVPPAHAEQFSSQLAESIDFYFVSQVLQIRAIQLLIRTLYYPANYQERSQDKLLIY